MNLKALRQRFRDVIVFDKEFQELPGERPKPLAMCFKGLLSGREGRLTRDDLLRCNGWPFAVGDSLLVGHYLPAEFKCSQVLGWPRPPYVIDTFVESKWLHNGLPLLTGHGLLDVAERYGIPRRTNVYKADMRQMFIDGGPTTAAEWGAGLTYCMEDVDDTAAIFEHMLPKLDFPRAVHRGRFMHSVAVMEHTGVPVDVSLLSHLQEQWPHIRVRLVETLPSELDVFEGVTFKEHLFEQWLHRQRIHWPRLPTGRLDLKAKTFSNLRDSHPLLQKLHEVRYMLGNMKLFKDLAVGHDGRNRCSLRPFGTSSGRNAPSNARFLFGASRAIRSLIQPPPGKAFLYLDYGGQEIAIAAALSGDEALLETYNANDIYIHFAQLAGAVPAGATEESHPNERALFKATMLAVGYGMGADSLGKRIGKTYAHGCELLNLHKLLYHVYWQWADRCVVRAMSKSHIHTPHGWQRKVGHWTKHDQVNTRSLGNFAVQGTGADMMRTAACYLTESGLEVCCPVHDAFSFCCPIDEVDATIEKATALMQKASIDVIGIPCKVGAEIVRSPDHYSDKRGREVWQKIIELAGPMSGRPG